MQKIFCFQVILLFCIAAQGQMRINAGTTVSISANTFIVVTGDLISSSNINGTGTIAMRGTALQRLNMNGLTIPRLTINNAANVQLLGHARVNSLLTFTAGKIIAGNYYLMLRSSATTSGAGAGKFVETNGTGELRKQVVGNLTNFLLPVGNGSNYTPVSVTTSGTYSSASVNARARGAIHPNKPAGSSSYLNTYWSITRPGVTGTVTANATYLASNVVGTETSLQGTFYSGSFNNSGSSINTTSNVVTSNVPTNGDVYAMSAATLKAYVNNREAREESRNQPGLTPNPVVNNAILNISMQNEESVVIRIVDETGKLAGMEYANFGKGQNQHTVKMSHLAKGVYQVQVRSASTDKTFTVVKQ